MRALNITVHKGWYTTVNQIPWFICCFDGTDSQIHDPITQVFEGKVPPAVFRQAFAFAIAFGSVLAAALVLHRVLKPLWQVGVSKTRGGPPQMDGL